VTAGCAPDHIPYPRCGSPYHAAFGVALPFVVEYELYRVLYILVQKFDETWYCVVGVDRWEREGQVLQIWSGRTLISIFPKFLLVVRIFVHIISWYNVIIMTYNKDLV